MKIILVGASGAIGRAIVELFEDKHTVISAGRQGHDVSVDMTDIKSVEQMYKTVGAVDAVICAAGSVHFAPLMSMTPENYHIGLNSKLMGQVNIVMAGLSYLNDGGSFTLTTGILGHDPIRQGSSAAMVNNALEGFVRGAAIEMPRSLRINAVSPTLLIESVPKLGHYFAGYEPVAAERAALAYLKSVDGAQNGQIYKVGW